MKYKGFQNDFSLAGKTAIVTGASRGVGKAIAELFAEKGAEVMLTSSNERCAQVAADIVSRGGKASAYPVDLKQRDAIGGIVQRTIQTFGKVDILVNNAGIGHSDYAEDITDELWDDVLAVNLTAPFVLSKCAAREMMKQKRGGRIINIASMAAVMVPDKHAAYVASKAGLVMLTRALAYEWADFAITCNAISTTIVNTDMGNGEWNQEDLARIPLNRFVEPQEVAAGALYLASDAAAMITGHNLQIAAGDGLSSMYKDRIARPTL